jgi:hypothetical protein
VAERDLIDGLIATYRELNSRVRPLPEDRLRLVGKEGSVRDVVARLRDDELRFSQALKQVTTGIPTPDVFGEEMAVVGTESSDDSTATILAQFGTARESTLAMLRSLPSSEWDTQIDGTRSVRSRIERLNENDRQHMERIVGLLGSPA